MFVDSGFFIALVNTRDQFHPSASDWQERIQEESRELLTTEFCLLELVNRLSSIGEREYVRELCGDLRGDPLVTIVPCSSELFQQGLELHGERDDKEWGLTDCISIVVMSQFEVTEALSYDRHFVQAGVRVLTAEDWA